MSNSTKPAVQAQPNASAPAATRRPASSKPAAEKQKPVAFVNWRIADEDDNTQLRSTRGFSMFDNEYLTLEDKALIELARKNGGTAVVKAELRIVISQEKPEKLDTSGIKLVK